MNQIDLKYVRRDNTNIRRYSDSLWRALRKERFKKADPNKFVNEMAAEQLAFESDAHSDFKEDVAKFIATKLTEREGKIFSLFVFGGRMGQADIGAMLDVCQATVSNELNHSLELFKKWYYPEGDHRYE